jgi:predicted DNA-binding protein (MmcQ/YjbR family)
VKAIDARFTRPVFARLRRLCLALPETHEAASWGHPNFRAGTRTFCTFEMIKGRPSVAFRLSPADVDRTARRQGFFATPYGRGLWVSRWVDDRVNWKLMAALVIKSYRSVAMKRMLIALAVLRKPAPAARARRTVRRVKNMP